MIKWMERDEKLSPRQFEKIEEILGVSLPRDYVDWFQQYQGIENRNAYISFKANESLHFDEFYSLDEIPNEVEDWYEEDRELKKIGLIVPFGFDSALNPYCFYYGQKRDHPIIIWFSSDDALSDIYEGSELNFKQVRIVRHLFTEFIADLYVRTDDL